MARHDFMLDVTLDERAGDFWHIRGRAGGGACRWRGVSPELLGRISAGTGGCRHHHSRRISIGFDFLSDHQRRHRGAAHFETGRHHPDFERMCGRCGLARVCSDDAPLPSPREFLDAIENAPVEVDQWQLEKLALVGLKHDVLLYTPGIAGEDLGSLRTNAFDSAAAAVAALIDRLPKHARVAVIPDGPYAYARVQE